MAQLNIIPQPSQVLIAQGQWTLEGKSTIGSQADPTWKHVADMLASRLNRATGIALPIVAGKGDISFVSSADAKLGGRVSGSCQAQREW